MVDEALDFQDLMGRSIDVISELKGPETGPDLGPCKPLTMSLT